MNGATVQIGELAQRTGVSRRSLRYYEQQGLLHAHRMNNGWRSYDEAAVNRVRNVRELLEAGLTVEDIQQVAPCLEMDDMLACDNPHEAIGMYEARLKLLDERMVKLQRHREELVGRIERLRDTEPNR